MTVENSEMVVEKGVPIPPLRRSGAAHVAREMEVGDSIVIPVSYGKQTAGNMGKATGFKFTQRREDDNIRIWRIA